MALDNIAGFLHSFADLILIPRCINCHVPVSFGERNLCSNCFEKIESISDGCEICNGIISSGECEICSDRKFYIKKNLSIAVYDGVIKKIIHGYKFLRIRSLKKHLTRLAVEKLKQGDMKFNILTSVPVSRKKKWERGYNQSELIARGLSRKLHIPFKTLLRERIRYKNQKELGYRDRFINILNKYVVIKPDRVKDKSILIVDDIFTTGATLNECARKLIEAGASAVFSITIARTGTKKA